MADEIQVTVAGVTHRFSSGAEVTIGRAPGVELQVSEPFVSGRHATLSFEDGRWIFRDLSMNGSFVAGQRVSVMVVPYALDVRLGHAEEGTVISLVPPAAAAPSPSATPFRYDVTAVIPRDLAGPPPVTPLGPSILILHSSGEFVVYAGQEVVFGRDPSCIITIDNPVVSRQHARLHFVGGGWVLDDLASNRGVTVDGSLTRQVRLVGSTTVWLGPEEAGEKIILVAPGKSKKQRNSNAPLLVGVGIVALLALLASGAVLLTRRTEPVLVAGQAGAQADQPAPTPAKGFDIVAGKKATVRVDVDYDQGTGWGSGTIISADGLILTNAHVAAPDAPGLAVVHGGPSADSKAVKITVAINAKGDDNPVTPTYQASVAAADGYLDLAVLRIDRNLDGSELDAESLALPALPVGDVAATTAGEEVSVLGFPGVGDTNSVTFTAGRIGSFVPDERLDTDRAWINTDAEIHHGNSGGLAMTADGKIIGVPTRFNNDTLLGVASADEQQNQLRSVNLATPLIDAAKAGTGYDQYTYVTDLTGAEHFEADGFGPASQTRGTTQTGLPAPAACDGSRSSSAGSSSLLVPRFDVSGMSEGIDVLVVAIDPAASGKDALVGKRQVRWTSDLPESGCVTFPMRLSRSAAGSVRIGVLIGPNFAVDAEQ